MKINSAICPGCGYKLRIETSRKLKSSTWARFAVMDVVGSFQVARIFHIHCDMKAKNTPRIYTREIVQHWLNPDWNAFEVISATCGGMGMSADHFGSEMSLKDKGNIWKYNVSVYKIHPDAKLLPVFQRNGFNTKVQDIPPFGLLKSLLSNSVTETLLKTKQFALLSVYLGDDSGRINRHWRSIKICIRSKYLVKEAGIYLDYLDLLHRFGKDLHNAKYVCPKNLHKEHDRFVKKRQLLDRAELQIRNREAAEKRKLEKVELQRIFEQKKSKFFGLSFSDGEIEIKHLDSIEDFITEGEALGHCVYTNSYYGRKDSICFSASVGGVKVETVEVSIKEFKIIQARGLRNTPSVYHSQIIDLVNKNMKLVKKRLKAETQEVAA